MGGATEGCPGWVMSNTAKMRKGLIASGFHVETSPTEVLALLQEKYSSPLLYRFHAGPWPSTSVVAPREVLVVLLKTLARVSTQAAPYAFDFVKRDAVQLAAGIGQKVLLLQQHPPRDEAEVDKYTSAAVTFGQCLLSYENTALLAELETSWEGVSAVRDWAAGELRRIEEAHEGRGGRYKEATVDLLRFLSQTTVADPPRTQDYGPFRTSLKRKRHDR